MNNWIPVSERLPPDMAKVRVWASRRGEPHASHAAFFYHGEFDNYDSSLYDITHWQHFPIDQKKTNER